MTIFAQGVDVGWVLAGLVTILGTVAGVVTILFNQLIKSKDQLIEAKEAAHNLALKQMEAEKLEEIGRKKSYQEIAAEALKSAMETANYYRQKEGKPPIIPAAAVISESHSPSTPEQREAALVATMRASMAQVKVMTGQAPRTEPPHAEGDSSSGDIKQGVIEVLKHSISEVPERTATKVVQKLEEQKEV